MRSQLDSSSHDPRPQGGPDPQYRPLTTLTQYYQPCHAADTLAAARPGLWILPTKRILPPPIPTAPIIMSSVSYWEQLFVVIFPTTLHSVLSIGSSLLTFFLMIAPPHLRLSAPHTVLDPFL